MISDKGKAVHSGELNGVDAGGMAAGQAPRAELLESLSALMDDEAEALEIRRLVKAMPATAEYTAAWRRFHAVRASLQQDVHQRPAVDLLPGIRAALATEQHANAMPAGSIAGRSVSGRVLRWGGQLAIAASVAAAVLVGYPALHGNSDGGTAAAPAVATVPVDAAAMPALNGEFNASPLTRTVSLDEAARSRLEKAVRNFSGTSAVINAGTPMFRNQLQPFSAAPAPVPVPADAGSPGQ